jgi:hypothetical protein
MTLIGSLSNLEALHFAGPQIHSQHIIGAGRCRATTPYRAAAYADPLTQPGSA